MLVLSRRCNEGIYIGDEIRVTVLKVKGNKVSIGIEVPGATRIRRLEIEGRSGRLSRSAAQPARVTDLLPAM